MTIALYYLSSTGNSLRVAQELHQRLPDSDLTPIVPLLGQDTIETRADTVGLIFPNFCMTIPIPLHDFLEKADLTSAQYIFAICTRGGTPSDAFDYINEVLQKQGRRLDAAARFPIKSSTDDTDRYHHPGVAYKNIAEQK